MCADFELLRARLRDPVDAAGALPGDHRRAAVAIALRLDRGQPEVLLMERAERDDDRWSGQISLPGGHAEEGDLDLVTTAARETQEEVGLDLAADAVLLGAMGPVQARARSGLLGTSIVPVVFGCTRVRELALGSEAVDAFWFPLDQARSGELDHTYRYEHRTLVRELPAWSYEGRVVWGLTYGILRDLLRVGADEL